MAVRVPNVSVVFILSEALALSLGAMLTVIEFTASDGVELSALTILGCKICASETDIESVFPCGVIVLASDSEADAESVLTILALLTSASDTDAESLGLIPIAFVFTDSDDVTLSL
jgi:hypothetical protein